MTKAYQLVDDYYSLNDSERFQAIELLAEARTNDAARELIRIYNQCEWRETKIQILQSLAHFYFERSLTFLFKIAANTTDLPLAEMAVQSIAQIKLPLASHFLIESYLQGPSHLKPSIALALAHRCDPTLAVQMVADLKKALDEQHIYLAKNLIFTLGEIKFRPATEILMETAHSSQWSDISLGAVVSLGKILRNDDKFHTLSFKFKKDIFQKQIFENAVKQISFRSQWKLKDYLNKYFESAVSHPAITLEISTFAPNDVINEIGKIDFQKTLTKQIQLMSKFPADQFVQWLQQAPADIVKQYENEVFNALSFCKSPFIANYLAKDKLPTNESWLQAYAVNTPEADKYFKDYFNSAPYSEMVTAEKITIINGLSTYLYTQIYQTKKLNECRKWIESQLDSENDVQVLSRWIRLCADHKLESSFITQWCEKNVGHHEMSRSILYYMESCPHPEFIPLIIKNFSIFHKNNLTESIFKTLISHKIDAVFLNQISQMIDSLTTDNDLKNTVLQFLGQHPIDQQKNYVTQCLNSKKPEVLIQAIITAKAFGKECGFSDLIAPHLKNTSKSIQGRAFDTLLSFNELRAQRLCIDYFKEHFINNEVVEKFIRSFQTPETTSDYFIKSLSDIVQKNPESEYAESLQNLVEQMIRQNNTGTQNLAKAKAEDIIKIDQRLKSEIQYYELMDETAKTSLRSAELPFHHPEIFDQYIDKSAIILGYAKAIDLVLEKHFAKKQLFPLLEKKLFDFQNIIHAVHLNEDYPVAERVLTKLGLEKYFSAQSLPVHKMSLIAKSILNTKIMNEHFKVLDGLRSWSVIFLLFARKGPQTKALIQLNVDEADLVQISKKLMWLQDIRNPVAHRQTVVDFSLVEEARKESLSLLKSLNFLFK